jgi:hypothetical protein
MKLKLGFFTTLILLVFGVLGYKLIKGAKKCDTKSETK